MIRNVYLIGHSCGAHILSHVFLCLPTPLPNTFISSHDPSTPLRVRLLEVLRKTRAAAFLDGIYDLDALIDEYPTYSFFVEAAFGKDKSRWAEACVLYEDEGKVRHLVPAVLDAARHARIVVAHATEDELLTPVQGRLWVDHLCRVGLEQNVVNDVETLVGTHDGCLHHVGLGELLYKLMTAA
ncbi:hypothetical protein QFC19_007325 [Naganishia cerealis]|uniref:Uncharacterized protein n=1 Tax=Naganishia cerealis TaxID=610337 RepID=A0ACC2V9P5_9TREE|nr:hypothetical protein QFC19_007325 [Naganishia cerealis]